MRTGAVEVVCVIAYGFAGFFFSDKTMREEHGFEGESLSGLR